MKTTWQETWTDRFYRSRPEWRDGTTEFHDLCRSLAPPGTRVLEIGAGATNRTSAFLSTLGELHGIDVSPDIYKNTHVKTAKLIEGDRYPHPDSSFDLAVSNYVVEHIVDASAHLRETHRVLRPNAPYVFRTPNLFHYVSLVSWLTPHRLHELVAGPLRNLPADSPEPWPTTYALNTPGAVRRHCALAGFRVERLDLVEKEPSYGMIARPLFAAFMAYERLVNSTPRLAAIRANMFVVLRRD